MCEKFGQLPSEYVTSKNFSDLRFDMRVVELMNEKRKESKANQSGKKSVKFKSEKN